MTSRSELDALLKELQENDGWLKIGSTGKVTVGFPRFDGSGHVTCSCEQARFSPTERIAVALRALFS